MYKSLVGEVGHTGRNLFTVAKESVGEARVYLFLGAGYGNYKKGKGNFFALFGVFVFIETTLQLDTEHLQS